MAHASARYRARYRRIQDLVAPAHAARQSSFSVTLMCEVLETTAIYTRVSIAKVRAVHAATHPAGNGTRGADMRATCPEFPADQLNSLSPSDRADGRHQVTLQVPLIP